jgi:hypothetical protein
MDPSVEFPPVFHEADRFSLDGQHRTIRTISWRLVLTVVATVFLAFAPLWPLETGHRELELGAIAAAVLFLVAFVLELRELKAHPERDWYDGRALAESVKTLAWRYAVAGAPYPSALPAASAAFADDVHGLGTDLHGMHAMLHDGRRPTPWMERLRGADLATRREAYLRLRVRDQEQWYAAKSAYNRRRGHQWNALLLGAEALGVAFALIKGLGIFPLDLACVMAAVIAGGAAWLAVKQHESLAAAYALASRELADIGNRLAGIDDEWVWANEVAGAEEAISREHTMWRAARSRPHLPK